MHSSRFVADCSAIDIRLLTARAVLLAVLLAVDHFFGFPELQVFAGQLLESGGRGGIRAPRPKEAVKIILFYL